MQDLLWRGALGYAGTVLGLFHVQGFQDSRCGSFRKRGYLILGSSSEGSYYLGIEVLGIWGLEFSTFAVQALACWLQVQGFAGLGLALSDLFGFGLRVQGSRVLVWDLGFGPSMCSFSEVYRIRAWHIHRGPARVVARSWMFADIIHQ